LLFVPKSRASLTDPAQLRALTHPLRIAIVDLLNLERTVTATRCAETTGESVASCSYHLSILAKYGFVEPAEGGRGREKPWRLVHEGHSWMVEDDMEPETAMAVEALSEVYLDQTAERMKWWARRAGQEPVAWRRAAGFQRTVAYLTVEELTELTAELEALARRYDARRLDPSTAPPGARPVEIFLGAWLPRPPEGAS
jgi:predicted ArsR family transcriptional regulator